VHIDRRRAAQLGFSSSDISNEIATATSGSIASYFQVNGIQYPIQVELPLSQRRSLASLSGLLLTPPTITSANGGGSANALVSNSANAAAATTSQSFGAVPLGALATIKTGLGPSQIARQNKQRRVDIDATVIGRPLGAVLADATAIMDAYKFPAGYRWQYGPEITQNNDTFSALSLVVLLAIALIYMLLASQFESFIDPLIIMMSVPLSIVGIVGSLWITNRSFGLTAFIGALMLVGIAVKNAILVVEFTKQLRAQGLSPRDALLQAGPLRLRPILMTTLATLGGMLPLALGIEAGSSPQAPLGRAHDRTALRCNAPVVSHEGISHRARTATGGRLSAHLPRSRNLARAPSRRRPHSGSRAPRRPRRSTRLSRTAGKAYRERPRRDFLRSNWLR